MESTGEESIDMSPVELLPTEILQKILSYLPVDDRVRVERVCKRWKNVSTERIWRDVQVLHIIQFKRTDLSKWSLLYSNYEFMKILKNSDKSFGMKGNKLYIPADELRTIRSLVSRAGQHIRRLLLFFNPHHTSAESMLSIIVRHCHNIEVIQLNYLEHDLEEYFSVTDVFDDLLSVNKQLHSISCQEEDYIIESLPLKDWRSLHLGGFSFHDKQLYFHEKRREIWEEKLVELIKNSPSLESFRSYQWTEDMSAAITKCEQLKTLHLPNLNTEVNDLMMDSSFLKRLTCLKLEGNNNDIIINLLSHCLNLESLGLFYTHISPLPDSWRLPLEIERAVLALPKLESLELTANLLTDKILSRLLKFKRLRIENSSKSITDNGIFELIMNSECLEKLEIPKINVTTELFNRLALNAGDRRRILEIEISSEVYKDTLKECCGTPIHIIEEETQYD